MINYCLVSRGGRGRGVGRWGVIFDPEGKQEMSYAWGIGEATNNQAEIQELWQGLSVSKQMEITKLTVVGDSMAIIHHMVNLTKPQDTQLRRMMIRTQHVRRFHYGGVLPCFRSLNALADKNTKLACTLQMGCLRKRVGVLSICHIP
jgi:hypothetical protein